jgi:hypothetical protein
MKSKRKVKALIITLIIVISLFHYLGGGKDLPVHSFTGYYTIFLSY